jgi:hypothetical protein
MDLLPTLTPDDLKDLGVDAVGHRRRMLSTIAVLSADGRSIDIPPAEESAPSPAPKTRFSWFPARRI